MPAFRETEPKHCDTKIDHSRISPAAMWIVFCALCNCAGWALSGLHALHRMGYALVWLLAFGTLVVWCVKTGARLSLPSRNRLKIRFRRPFPLAFLILAILATLGGVLYPPTNYDALAYRTPRVLHWLAEKQWHWIHTDFLRLNTRGCGIEWVTAPLFLFSRTDRCEFLINIICLFLLPARTFSLLTCLGVSRRTAWFWMWLLPTGYIYLLQAGSIANDLFGAICAISAIDFALRARREKRIGHLYISILAAALMTASKAFNLVILLPWAIAVAPSFPLLLRRPLASVLVFFMGASASLIPTALLNIRYCGDWTGMAAEPQGFGSGPPLLHIIVNAVLLFLHNMAPPVFPFSKSWDVLVAHMIPTSISVQLEKHFEQGARLQIGEMQMEEAAGLGLGVSFLLAWILIRQIRSGSFSFRTSLKSIWTYECLVSLGAWLALLVFMAEAGLVCPARYLAPFYPLLIAPLLKGVAAFQLTRSVRWYRAALASFALAALVLILTPPRPLWPVMTVLRTFGAESSSNPLLKRAWTVYSIYRVRGDAFESVEAVLPADANPLGMITSDDPEASLWYPFGSRRILHITHADTPEQTRQRGIKYALVSSQILSQNFQMSLDEWLSRNDAKAVQHWNLKLRAGKEPTDWYLVRLR
jgi:hypothetical protein